MKRGPTNPQPTLNDCAASCRKTPRCNCFAWCSNDSGCTDDTLGWAPAPDDSCELLDQTISEANTGRPALATTATEHVVAGGRVERPSGGIAPERGEVLLVATPPPPHTHALLPPWRVGTQAPPSPSATTAKSLAGRPPLVLATLPATITTGERSGAVGSGGGARAACHISSRIASARLPRCCARSAAALVPFSLAPACSLDTRERCRQGAWQTPGAKSWCGSHKAATTWQQIRAPCC